MAFVNSNAKGRHGQFQSSRLKATDVGRIYDALCVEDAAAETKEYIDMDNGVALSIKDFTGNGLQEVYAEIAKTTDKIAVTGDVALVKDARIKRDEVPSNWYRKAGVPIKTYEVLDDDYEVFAVADYQFTDASVANIKVGAYVVTDGNGMWVAQAAAPDASKYGFIGKIHSLQTDRFNLAADGKHLTTIVRIQCVQNKQL
jgi:hypothetical protein